MSPWCILTFSVFKPAVLVIYSGKNTLVLFCTQDSRKSFRAFSKGCLPYDTMMSMLQAEKALVKSVFLDSRQILVNKQVSGRSDCLSARKKFKGGRQ